MKLSEEYKNGVGVLTIIEPAAPPPGAEARLALSKMFQRVAGSVAASAVVFEGTGFRASLVRSVATSLTLIAKQPFPHRMFSSVEDAASWLSEELPATNEGKATADDIVAASRMMRDASRR